MVLLEGRHLFPVLPSLVKGVSEIYKIYHHPSCLEVVSNATSNPLTYPFTLLRTFCSAGCNHGCIMVCRVFWRNLPSTGTRLFCKYTCSVLADLRGHLDVVGSYFQLATSLLNGSPQMIISSPMLGLAFQLACVSLQGFEQSTLF